VHPTTILVNNKLDAQFFFLLCFFFSYSAPMFRAAMCPSSGELLYQCDTSFMSLCVYDRLVCRSICSCIPDGHTRKSIECQVGYLQGSYNSFYVFDNLGEIQSHKKMWYNYSKIMFTGWAKPIRIIGDPHNQLPH